MEQEKVEVKRSKAIQELYENLRDGLLMNDVDGRCQLESIIKDGFKGYKNMNNKELSDEYYFFYGWQEKEFIVVDD